jgi:hypothetical protein
MVKTERTTINETPVIVVQLPARKALLLKTKLVKLLGPAIAKLFVTDSLPSAKSGLSIDQDIDPVALSSAMAILVDRLEPDAFLSLVLECLASTKVEVNGSPIDVTRETFDAIFSGGLAFMYKVLWFSLKVNYADFFDLEGIGNLLKTREKMPIPREPMSE